jgi:hypothetical protein
MGNSSQSGHHPYGVKALLIVLYQVDSGHGQGLVASLMQRPTAAVWVGVGKAIVYHRATALYLIFVYKAGV